MMRTTCFLLLTLHVFQALGGCLWMDGGGYTAGTGDTKCATTEVKEEKACVPACADDYVGTGAANCYVAADCPANQPWIKSGCTKKQCTAPAATDGYVIDTEVCKAGDFDLCLAVGAVTCADGYQADGGATVFAEKCADADGAVTLTGCVAKDTCAIPDSVADATGFSCVAESTTAATTIYVGDVCWPLCNAGYHYAGASQTCTATDTIITMDACTQDAGTCALPANVAGSDGWKCGATAAVAAASANSATASNGEQCVPACTGDTTVRPGAGAGDGTEFFTCTNAAPGTTDGVNSDATAIGACVAPGTCPLPGTVTEASGWTCGTPTAATTAAQANGVMCTPVCNTNFSPSSAAVYTCTAADGVTDGAFDDAAVTCVADVVVGTCIVPAVPDAKTASFACVSGADTVTSPVPDGAICTAVCADNHYMDPAKVMSTNCVAGDGETLDAAAGFTGAAVDTCTVEPACPAIADTPCATCYTAVSGAAGSTQYNPELEDPTMTPCCAADTFTLNCGHSSNTCAADKDAKATTTERTETGTWDADCCTAKAADDPSGAARPAMLWTVLLAVLCMVAQLA